MLYNNLNIKHKGLQIITDFLSVGKCFNQNSILDFSNSISLKKFILFEKSSNPRLIFQKRAINPPEPFKKPETESKLKKVQSYQSRYYIITYIIVLVVVVVLDKKLLAHTPLILWLLTKLTNSSVLFFIES